MFSIYKVTIFFGNIGIFCCCNKAFLLVGFPKLLKITTGIALFFFLATSIESFVGRWFYCTTACNNAVYRQKIATKKVVFRVTSGRVFFTNP